MSYPIRRVLAKPWLILDEMCHLYGKFASYFSSYKGPNVKLSPLFFVLVSTCLALHHIKQGLHVKNIHSVKKGVGRQHTTFTSCQNAACSNNFFLFLWRVDYALGENVLTDQMWFLLLISNWEDMTRILIFLRHCFWSAWFALWCKSIFSLTSFET